MSINFKCSALGLTLHKNSVHKQYATDVAVLVSMEAGRACGYRDDKPRVPALSLGLSSVRLIVNQYGLQHTRVSSDDQKQLYKYDLIIEGYDDFSLDQSRGRVLFETLGFYLSRWIPSVSFWNFGVLAVTIGLFAPKMLSYLVVYPFCRLIFGTLYPAYASYKAVRTKNLKEYVSTLSYLCTTRQIYFVDVSANFFPLFVLLVPPTSVQVDHRVDTFLKCGTASDAFSDHIQQSFLRIL